MGMVGPADVDLSTAMTAPGWEPGPPPRSAGDTDLIIEYIMWNSVEPAPQGFDCTISVKQIGVGHAPPYKRGLSEEEVSSVAEGDLTFIEVGATCHPSTQ
jgi:hypothetical protein